MKKYFLFAVLAIAIGVFGRTGVTHAQTASANTQNTAQLQQQLDVAKATLVNLQMQAGMVPQGDDQFGGTTGTTGTTGSTGNAGTGAVLGTQAQGLTASQVSYFEGVLSELVTSLAQLNATVQANPTMTDAQHAQIAQALTNMNGIVSTMVSQIAQDEQANGAPIAVTTPSTGASHAQGGTSTGVAQANPGTTTVTAPATTTQPATNVQTAAQAGSIWSFTKSNWPVIVIILLVIAILAILFWPEGGKKPTQTTTVTSTTKTTQTSPQGPQRIETKETKVTVMKTPVEPNASQQQPQQKTA